MKDRTPIKIDLRCGCGALLLVEYAPEYESNGTPVFSLATAWVAAHRPHHVEPKLPSAGEEKA